MNRILFCIVCLVVSLVSLDASAGPLANIRRNHRQRVENRQERRANGEGISLRHPFGGRFQRGGNCSNGACNSR